MIQDIHFLFVCPTFVLSPDGLQTVVVGAVDTLRTVEVQR